MEEGGVLETVRDRMECVPDLRLGFPVPLADISPDYYPRCGRTTTNSGPTEAPPPTSHTLLHSVQGLLTRYLAELKVMSAVPSRYPRAEPSSRSKQVEGER